MKVLVDAQLLRRLAEWFVEAGHDALHTTDLPAGNRTTDAQLTAIADEQARVVVTKDADFVDAHMLRNKPGRLLLISLGNLSNAQLEQLLRPLIRQIAGEFESNQFIELGRTGLVIRG